MLGLSLGLAIIIFGLTIRRPALGASALVLILPAYLLRTEIAGVPTTALEVSIFAAAAAVLVSLWRKQLSWHWVRMTKTTWWLLGAWVVAWIITTALADDRQAALGALKAWLVDPLIFIGILAVTITTPRDRRLLLSAAILSGFHVAIAGLVQLAVLRETLQEGRLSSYFAPVANYAAMYLAPLVILQTGLLLHSERRGKFWWSVFGVTTMAVIATFSFAGFLSLAVGGIVLWWKLPAGRLKKSLLMTGVVVGFFGLIVLTQTKNFNQHFNFSDRSSGSVRQQIWVTSWALVKKNPIAGIGPNNFETAYRAELPHHYFPPLEWLVAQPHNLVLALWLETGLLGLLAFSGLFMYHLALVWRKFLPRPSERSVAIASLAALIAIITHGLFDTPYFKNDLAPLFLLIAILPWLGQEKNS